MTVEQMKKALDEIATMYHDMESEYGLDLQKQIKAVDSVAKDIDKAIEDSQKEKIWIAKTELSDITLIANGETEKDAMSALYKKAREKLVVDFDDLSDFTYFYGVETFCMIKNSCIVL